MYLASWNRPVVINNPRREMKVSRPQQRMNPVEKCGRPAARQPADCSPGRAEGKVAEHVSPCSWMEPIANALTRDEPFWTKLKYKRTIVTHRMHRLGIRYRNSRNFFVTYFCTFNFRCNYYLRFPEAVNVCCSKNSLKLNFQVLNFHIFTHSSGASNTTALFSIGSIYTDVITIHS